ncbi:MAG: hypothetical protein PVJ74_09560, partial [Gammaproteobacteria bacterium]
METLIRFLLWGVLATGLSGCGFQLQGRADYGEELEAVYLQVPDDATPLARELSRSLEISALKVVDDAAAATAVLQIVSDDTGRSVESVDAQNR